MTLLMAVSLHFPMERMVKYLVEILLLWSLYSAWFADNKFQVRKVLPLLRCQAETGNKERGFCYNTCYRQLPSKVWKMVPYRASQCQYLVVHNLTLWREWDCDSLNNSEISLQDSPMSWPLGKSLCVKWASPLYYQFLKDSSNIENELWIFSRLFQYRIRNSTQSTFSWNEQWLHRNKTWYSAV